MNSEEYKYLVVFFSETHLIKPFGEHMIQSYANADQLLEIGLDPEKDTDVVFSDNEGGVHKLSINLFSKTHKKNHSDFLRDLNLKNILGELG